MFSHSNVSGYVRMYAEITGEPRIYKCLKWCLSPIHINTPALKRWTYMRSLTPRPQMNIIFPSKAKSSYLSTYVCTLMPCSGDSLHKGNHCTQSMPSYEWFMLFIVSSLIYNIFSFYILPVSLFHLMSDLHIKSTP